MSNTESTRVQTYWYITYCYYCPVCGREEKYRERVDEKPKTAYIWKDKYDYCQEMGG